MKHTINIYAMGLVLLWAVAARGQEDSHAHAHAHAELQMLGGHADFTWTLLPESRLRQQVEALPDAARERAQTWLRGFRFPPADLEWLSVDARGAIYYADPAPAAVDAVTHGIPERQVASLPISPFPTNLHFHSRPNAANVLYIDFDGETVSGTAWNTSLGRDPIAAVAYSRDGDFTTFSATEQADIESTWRRVAEDYAAFDINVTTERPDSISTRTAHAVVTRNTDADGLNNPAAEAGGVAYVNVFADRFFSNYRPAWVYANNLSFVPAFIAEAVSHEIGHNMGLSHDGKTDGTAYYSGHGSGETSWGPIMGSSFLRNVTQWSRGDYDQANNAEDDMAIIAGKLQYREDDHAATPVGATFLTVSGGSNIVSTTPEVDPFNMLPENKGVIEFEGDSDHFSFTTGAGEIALTVKPWVSPASYRGGNLDVKIALYDSSGQRVVAVDPATTTSASLGLAVSEGQYFLRIEGTGAGNPTNSPPSGYTVYGSVGQYFISGHVVEAQGVTVAPQAELQVNNVVDESTNAHLVSVTYLDDVGIDVSSLDSADLRALGPNAYSATATFSGVDTAGDGSPRRANYRVSPPGGSWDAGDNGTYVVSINSNAVADVEGAFVVAQTLGEFACAIPTRIYRADLDVDPGWVLEGDWDYGAPQGSAGDPAGGVDGPNVIGVNLGGKYARNADVTYAEMPPVDCSASIDSVVLRFRRWLGVESGDRAVIQISTNGTTWVDVWSSAGRVTDSQWVSIQYDVTALAAGQDEVSLRWGLSSNRDGRTSFGWNLDAVEILGSGGMLDTQSPGAILQAPDLLEGGNPNYQFSVVYSDNVAVATASFDDLDLVVLGPNAYSNAAAFQGADYSSDGTPRSASYSIPAPAGVWHGNDNGDYVVLLNNDEVLDTSGNPVPHGNMGGIRVEILPQWTLTATPNNPAAGTIVPGGGIYRDGTRVTLMPLASNYYAFARWSGDVSGSNPVIDVLMSTNKAVTAFFDEIVTGDEGIPHWWLAQYGFTNDFEGATAIVGGNGMTYGASYVAGLIPTNTDDVLALAGQPVVSNAGVLLTWEPVSGRVYSIFRSTRLAEAFTRIPDATNLPWTIDQYMAAPTNAQFFYRLGVRLQE